MTGGGAGTVVGGGGGGCVGGGFDGTVVVGGVVEPWPCCALAELGVGVGVGSEVTGVTGAA